MKKRYKLIIFFAVILSLTMLKMVNSSETIKERYEKLQIFTQVLSIIQKYYVEDVDTDQLIYGGIKGMMQQLDPHTTFLLPEVYKDFQSETSGEFGGIGIEVTIRDGILTIISPIEDTPAWKAGLKPGDKIVSINGKTTRGFNLEDASQKLKSKKGTTIKLGIFRQGFKNPKDYPIVIETIRIKSVKYTNLNEGYAYVRITSFNESTSRNLKNVLKAHAKKNKKINGLIIDLRKNPGGLLDQAIEVSDLFIPSGIIVSTRGKNESKKNDWYSKKEGTYEGFPIVTLIDQYSASASEIVAGALKDNKRALIIGQKSFGKGSVQSIIKLSDNSAIKLTIARYYTPSGASIQATGISPDIRVEDIDTKALKEATNRAKNMYTEKDIAGHLQGSNSTSDNSFDFWWDEDYKNKKSLSQRDLLLSKDFQVLQAYNYLRAWTTMDGFNKIPQSRLPASAKKESINK